MVRDAASDAATERTVLVVSSHRERHRRRMGRSRRHNALFRRSIDRQAWRPQRLSCGRARGTALPQGLLRGNALAAGGGLAPGLERSERDASLTSLPSCGFSCITTSARCSWTGQITATRAAKSRHRAEAWRTECLPAAMDLRVTCFRRDGIKTTALCRRPGDKLSPDPDGSKTQAAQDPSAGDSDGAFGNLCTCLSATRSSSIGWAEVIMRSRLLAV